MKQFWKGSKQTEQGCQTSAAVPDKTPIAHSGVPKAAFRTPSCWAGSRAVGEAEVVSSPSGSPKADKIKAGSGTACLVTVQPQVSVQPIVLSRTVQSGCCPGCLGTLLCPAACSVQKPCNICCTCRLYQQTKRVTHKDSQPGGLTR